ncbi:MAG TPA: MFS transporter [Paraburkholderia sp.]|nr:MFS transporter [Paraburkholderia sp.]
MNSGSASSLETRTVRKTAWRLLPILIVSYLIASIDRVNISFAASGGMSKDIGITATQYGFAAGIFFISYFIFEVPSNLLLQKYGARKWIARIMVTWGAFAILAGFINHAWTLYVMRFLLGAAEAGFFPGVILYMTYWFPSSYRSRMIAAFVFSVPISGGIGAAMSGWLLKMNGVLGLAGWRWLFFFEGAPAILLAVVVFLFLTDKPAQAKWLQPDEREWLVRAIYAEQTQAMAQENGKPGIWSVLMDPRVIMIIVIYFMNLIATWGVQFFMPHVVKMMGNSNMQTGLLSSIPFFCTPIGLLVLSWSSDRTGERKWHCAAGGLLGAIGLGLAGLYSHSDIALIGFAIATGGLFGARGPLWALPSQFLTGKRIAVGIALINAIGNLSGSIAPPIIGWIKDRTGDYSMGMYFLAGAAAVSAVAAVFYSPNRHHAELGATSAKLDGHSTP